MDLGLTGRRAAVAAATSGLGFAAARALIAEGAQVAICGRDPKRLDTAVALLNNTRNGDRDRGGNRDGNGNGNRGGNGDGDRDRDRDPSPSGSAGRGRAYGVVADVGSAEGAAEFVAEAEMRLGGIDILVTNAGGPPSGTFSSTPIEDYLPALELNLLSVVAMCKAAVPAMQARRWGRVVAITSISVRQPIPSLILSNTARAGATGFLRTLAREVAPDGVTVNSLLPGSHGTDRLRELHGADLSGVAAQIPIGRVGDPDEFGAFLAFLCSAQAGFITGTAIPVDGGAYMGLL